MKNKSILIAGIVGILMLASVPLVDIDNSEDGYVSASGPYENWMPLGPMEGDINSLQIHDGVIYAGSDNGLYKSTDDGESWTQIGLNGKNVFAFLVTDDAIYVSASYALYVSTDDGKNWNNTNLTSEYLTDIVVDDAGDVYILSSYFGVYKTSDNGKNWTIRADDTPGLFHSLVVDGDGTLYARSLDGGIYKCPEGEMEWTPFCLIEHDISLFQMIDGVFYAWTWDTGLMISRDLGYNWTQTGNIVSDEIVTLSIDDHGNMYIGGYNDGVWKSTDGGGTWHHLDLSNMTVYAIMTSGDAVFAGTEYGMYKSTDGGDTWTAHISGMNNASIADVLFHDGCLYVCTGQGLYKSTDDGNTWIRDDHFEHGSYFRSINVDSEGALYAMVYYQGLYKSTNGGDTWAQIFPIDYVVSVCIDEDDVIYVAEISNVINISTDGGDTWVQKTLITENTFDWIENIVVDKGIIYVLMFRNGVIASEDGGDNWELIIGGQYYSFAIDDGIFYFGTSSEGLFKSTDRGKTIEPTDFKGPIDSILIENNEIYIISEDKLYKSDDGWETWECVWSLGISIRSIAVNGDALYIGTSNNGLYVNDNGSKDGNPVILILMIALILVLIAMLYLIFRRDK